MQHTAHHDVTFGDCDPAGIVYYPNNFRWMDATFHSLLKEFGGHEEICQKIGSVGLGLIDASAKFRSPLRDGDNLMILLQITNWAPKVFTLSYEARVKDRLAFTGQEVRCVFESRANGIAAGNTGALHTLIEGDHNEPKHRY